jgi:transposase
MTASTISLEQHIKDVSTLKEEIAFLKEQLDWFKKQLFGQKADKFVDTKNGQQLCFEGFDKLVAVQSEEKQTVPAHQRAKSKRNGQDKITLPADLPIERQILDIPDEAKVCPETGEPLVKIGEEVTSKLAHKPASFFIKQIVRPKYALPQKSEGGVLTADLPESLLTRCQADESLLADILVKKFGDHLPLYRQSEIMAREGVNIYLFMLEKVAWARSEDERLRIRQEKEIPIIDRLIGAVKDKLVNW